MSQSPPHPSFPVHFSCTQWLHFPPHSVSVTLASPNFLNLASLQTPGHFRSLPDSTNMFFGPFPRILWHTPMPTPNLLPCLTQIQRTARGQWRWRHPYSCRAVMVPLTTRERKTKNGWRERQTHIMPFSVWHAINVWTWFVLCRKAAQFEPLPKNIHSWSLWWKLWLCLTSAVKLWTSDERLNEREMTERWERGERGMGQMGRGWERDERQMGGGGSSDGCDREGGSNGVKMGRYGSACDSSLVFPSWTHKQWCSQMELYLESGGVLPD